MTEKSIINKLLIKPRQQVLIVNIPDTVKESIDAFPEGVIPLYIQSSELTTSRMVKVDVILVFVHTKLDMQSLLSPLRPLLMPNGLYWVAYRKLTSKESGDINRDSLRQYGLTIGLNGVSLVSIDENWSAMRFKIIG